MKLLFCMNSALLTLILMNASVSVFEYDEYISGTYEFYG